MSPAIPGAALDPASYAVGGVPPRRAVRVATVDELAGTLRAAARDGLAVVPWGGGTGMQRIPRPARYDLALDLGALDRVIEHNPDDLTLTAECGAGIGALAALLAGHHQELPLECAHADRATLGGVLAANASGPRRLRFGAPRDRILGARFVLADGTIARSGGKVVKNVAGYGIHRLLCGSHGALAVIVEASLKLAPAPEDRVALVFHADRAALADARRWAILPRREPAAVTVLSPGLASRAGVAPPGACAVIVGLEDDGPRNAEQEAALTRALGTPAARMAGGPVAALWRELASLQAGANGTTWTTADNTPAAIAALEGGEFVFHAPAGRLHRFGGGEDPGPRFARIDPLRAAPGRATPAGVTALRTRIRGALDPAGTFALGEGWIAGA
jgi:glycolate oxidase FAD binding subunit